MGGGGGGQGKATPTYSCDAHSDIETITYIMVLCCDNAIFGSCKHNDCYTGIDIVDHEDILPYVPTGDDTLEHDLFHQFFKSSKGDSKCCHYWT